MASNAFIELIARLNRKDSVNQIKTDLKDKVAKDLNKSQALKVQCHIDTSNTAIASLQNELKSLSDKLKINIGIDSKALAEATQAQTQSKDKTTSVKIETKSAQDSIAQLGRLLRDNVTNEATEVLDGLLNRIRTTLGDSATIWTDWTKNTKGALTSFSISVREATGDLTKFNYAVNDKGKVEPLNLTGSDKGVEALVNRVNKSADILERRLTNLKVSATELQNITSQSGKDNLANAYTTAQTAIENLRKADNSNFDSLRNKANSAIDAYNNVIKAQNSLISVTTKATNEAEKQSRALKKSYEDALNPNRSNPIQNQTSRTEIENAYNKAVELAEKLKQANAETFDKWNNELKEAVNNFEILKTKIISAETAATKLRAKPVEVVRENELSTLNQFVAKLSNSALPSVQNLVTEAEKLRNQLANVTDKQGLTDYLNSFSTLEKEFESLNTQAKVAKSALSSLGKLSQTTDVKALASEYQNVLSQISTAKTADDFRSISNTLATLKPLFDEVIQKTNDETTAAKRTKEAIAEIVRIYDKITDLNKKLTTGNLSSVDTKLTKDKIKEQEQIANNIRWQLRFENLYTTEVQKQIIAIKKKSESIVEARNREAEFEREFEKKLQAENEAFEKQKTAIIQIDKAYSKIAGYTKDLYSGKLTDVNASFTLAHIAEQRQIIDETRTRLENEGLINQAITERIRLGEVEITESQLIAESEKKRREAEIASTEEERKRKNILSEISGAYAQMASLYQKAYSPNSSASVSEEANRQIDAQQTIIDEKLQELKIDNLLTEATQKEIDSYTQKYQNIINIKNLENADLKAKKEETEELKKQKQMYQEISAIVTKYQRSLSQFNNANVVKQNAGNTVVGNQITTNSGLLEQLKPLQEALANKNLSTAQLTQIKQTIDNLIPSLQNATKNSEQLKASLNDTRVANAVLAKYNNLKNSMETFANVSQKAVNSTLKMKTDSGITTFADEWNKLINRLNDPKILGNQNAIQKLTNDFHNFQGQARSAGLTTNKFLVDMGSQLRMVLNRYISLYAVIGYIRRMVDAVKELDNAMINLRRVTSESERGYTQFLEKANEQARELKVTTSELVEQTYQWAKLGYDINDALELSKASTIFAKVADTTQEQSLQNLITIMKAYGIEAKNVMDIVDKLDNLNNRFAVSAAGLGEGLERSASALAMSGNTLDQSLAMLTGAGEITQNLENTGKHNCP